MSAAYLLVGSLNGILIVYLVLKHLAMQASIIVNTNIPAKFAQKNIISIFIQDAFNRKLGNSSYIKKHSLCTKKWFELATIAM